MSERRSSVLHELGGVVILGLCLLLLAYVFPYRRIQGHAETLALGPTWLIRHDILDSIGSYSVRVLADSTPTWLTLLVGLTTPIVAALAGVYIVNRQAAANLQQEREGRQAERDATLQAARESREADRREFQRETLLALQLSLQDLVRATGEASHQDIMHARAQGAWLPRGLLGDDLNDRLFKLFQTTNLLVVRVEDEPIRNLVTSMREHSVRVTMAQTEAESEAAMADCGAAFQDVNARIGGALRALA